MKSNIATIFFIILVAILALATVSALDETIVADPAEEVITPSFSINISSVPSSGFVPLSVQFASTSTSDSPLTFAWDFNQDQVIDSTIQNPLYIFQEIGEYDVILTAANTDGESVTQNLLVSVLEDTQEVALGSYFPHTFKQGPQQEITVVIVNEGKASVKNLKAKITGAGVQYLSSTTIDELAPGDEDSLVVRMNIINSGNLTVSLKVLDQVFSLTIQVATEVQYSPEELQSQLAVIKNKLQEQEGIYADKKAEGYFVSEVYDSIKSTKEQLREAQQQILTSQFSSAKVSLDLADSSLGDITEGLKTAKKQEVTFLLWLKENAVAITAILAAVGTVGGVVVKLTNHAKRLGENVQKVIIKRTIKETKDSPSHSEMVTEVTATTEKKEAPKKDIEDEHKETS